MLRGCVASSAKLDPIAWQLGRQPCRQEAAGQEAAGQEAAKLVAGAGKLDALAKLGLGAGKLNARA